VLTAYSDLEAAAEASHPDSLYPDILATSMRRLGRGAAGRVGARLARVP
jgi:hypothetical protein